MTCPQQVNIEAKQNKKYTKYRQLASEPRERRPGHEIWIIHIAAGVLGSGIKDALPEVGWVFKELPETEPTIIRTVAEMLKHSRWTLVTL